MHVFVLYVSIHVRVYVLCANACIYGHMPVCMYGFMYMYVRIYF